MKTPAVCPVCGETVPRGAVACPHCGADERTGWDDEQTRYDGLDLPDPAFEDDSASPRRKESGRKSTGIIWKVAGVLLLLLFLGLIFRPGF